MSDLKFNCQACGGHLIVDEVARGSRVQCPHCSCYITIPQQPVWLPIVNAAMLRLVGDLFKGYTGDQPAPGNYMNMARARVELKEAIMRAGFNPGTAGVEPGGPEDISDPRRIEKVLKTNLQIMQGYQHRPPGYSKPPKFVMLEDCRLAGRSKKKP
jgi:DNA-directed RNA polymerase subunit RPC12/RpoP